MYLYKDELTSSVIFILLETNVSEAREYLHVYFTAPVIRLLLIFLIPSILILWVVNRAIYRFSAASYANDIVQLTKKLGQLLKRVISIKNSIFLSMSVFFQNIAKHIVSHGIFYKWAISLTVFLSALFIYIKAEHFKHHILYAMEDGYEQYKQEIQKYKSFLNNSQNSPYIKSVKKEDNNKHQTLIVVIGESTTKLHMGIYGYYRNTSPNLKALGKQIICFNDVISPHSHTIESLEKVLTFGSTDNPNDKEKGTVIQLAQAAGYKTYWISNQNPIGAYETLLTMIAKTADQSYFINMGSTTEQKNYYKESYDEKLFPFIDKALSEPEPKKIIFVHLYGTHALYSARYPAKYNIFTDQPHTKYPSERATDAINTYDNAVLYNDFVISQIINMLKEQGNGGDQQLIYFSDHGEEVFQSMNFEGHTESIGTYPMFQIPFIYWTNQQNRLNAFEPYRDRSYMIDNLIYSIADLLNIQFNGRDDHKSLFSPQYEPRKRIVKHNIDFDKEIKP